MWVSGPGQTGEVRSAPRPSRPFWLHQFAEYVVGLALIAQGLQSADPLLPSLAGAVILINTTIAKGPLSAFAFVSPGAHRVLDVIMVVMLGVLAVVPGVDMAMRLILGSFAIVLVVVMRTTRYDRHASGRGRYGSDTGTGGDRAEDLGRRAGRMAGQGVKAWRSRR